MAKKNDNVFFTEAQLKKITQHRDGVTRSARASYDLSYLLTQKEEDELFQKMVLDVIKKPEKDAK